jgi:MFS superfamily sulfate permease-like transporter
MAGAAVKTFFLALFMTLIIGVAIGTFISCILIYLWKESYKNWDAWMTQQEQNGPPAAGIQMVGGQQMAPQ